MEEVFDNLHIGLATVDARRVVVRSNAAFRAVTESHDGLWMDPDGRLCCVRKEDHDALARTVRSFVSSGTWPARSLIPVFGTAGGLPHILSASRAAAGDLPLVNLALAPSGITAGPVEEALRESFGLTPKQAAIAVSLAAGADAAALSVDAGIARNTVYVHAKRTFKKLSSLGLPVQGQQGLVRLVSMISSVVSFNRNA